MLQFQVIKVISWQKIDKSGEWLVGRGEWEVGRSLKLGV